MKTLDEALKELDQMAAESIERAARTGGTSMVSALRRHVDDLREFTIAGHQQTHRHAIEQDPRLISWNTVRAVCHDGYSVHYDDDGRLVLSDNNGWTQATTPRQALIVLGVIQHETVEA